MSSAKTSIPREYPILMSPEMAKATLNKRKTQTRRLTGLRAINAFVGEWEYLGTTIVTEKCNYDRLKLVINSKGVPKNRKAEIISTDEYEESETVRQIFIFPSSTKTTPNSLYAIFKHKETDRTVWIRSPYGKQGDLLWCRETRYETSEGIVWASDLLEGRSIEDGIEKKCIPSIHMKRQDARLILRVNSCSVERLADISREAAIAEGIDGYVHALYRRQVWRDYQSKEYPSNTVFEKPEASFFSLIESIHGKDILKGNPYVWVVKYKMV